MLENVVKKVSVQSRDCSKPELLSIVCKVVAKPVLVNV